MRHVTISPDRYMCDCGKEQVKFGEASRRALDYIRNAQDVLSRPGKSKSSERMEAWHTLQHAIDMLMGHNDSPIQRQ